LEAKVNREVVGSIAGTLMGISAICTYFGTGSFWIAAAVWLGLGSLAMIVHYYNAAK